MTKRILDKDAIKVMTQKFRWEFLGWFVAIFSSCVLVTGIWFNIKAVIITGVLFVVLGIFLIIMGKVGNELHEK
jgi:uncharacterized membrane protein